MKNIRITTCNSMYEDGKEVGRYHEIHVVNYLSGVEHLIATIDSIIDNNKAYGCSDTILESVYVACNTETAAELNEYYDGFYDGVRVVTEN